MHDSIRHMQQLQKTQLPVAKKMNDNDVGDDDFSFVLPGVVPTSLYLLPHLILATTLELDAAINPVSQMRNLCTEE